MVSICLGASHIPFLELQLNTPLAEKAVLFDPEAILLSALTLFYWTLHPVMS